MAVIGRGQPGTQARPFDGDRRTITEVEIRWPAETSVHYPAMMGVSTATAGANPYRGTAGFQFASVGIDGKQLTLRPDREIAGPPRLRLMARV